MTTLILYMSMSLDGFIAGPNDGEGHPLGQDGHRLHDWLRDAASTPSRTGLTPGPAGRCSTR